jgi:hypothetical protein
VFGLGEEPVPDDACGLTVHLGDETGVTGAPPAGVEDRQLRMGEHEFGREPLLRGIHCAGAYGVASRAQRFESMRLTAGSVAEPPKSIAPPAKTFAPCGVS